MPASLSYSRKKSWTATRAASPVLRLMAHSFFGFHRLMHAVAPPPPLGQPSGELVHNHHFASAHDVVPIAEEFPFDQQCPLQMFVEFPHRQLVQLRRPFQLTRLAAALR